MHKRQLIIVGIVLIGATLLFAITTFRQQAQDKSHQKSAGNILITITQLPVENGVFPVELRCENVELNPSNRLGKVSCILVNNSDKNITALVIAHSISTEVKGKPSSISGAITIETLIHPSLREERKDSFILTKEVSPIYLSPTTLEEGSEVKAVSMQVDFIEFEDNSKIGASNPGAKVIADIREGAAKYRGWLIKNFDKSNESETVISKLLENGQRIPKDELKSSNVNQTEGMKVFQKFARQIYSTKGIQGLKKVLRKSVSETSEVQQ